MLDDTFWSDETKALLQVLLPFIVKGAEMALTLQTVAVEQIGITVDWTQAYTEAADWARKHGGKMVTEMGATTRKRVGGIVADWIESGESLPELEKRLLSVEEFAFSRKRARLIAQTETTTAFSGGELAAAREMERAGFSIEKQWETVQDDVVCDICRPLQYDGTNAVQGAMGYFQTVTGNALLGPAAHPGCRCWMNEVPVMPA